ncbi:MAG: hypothetical protein QHJ73_03205, partial [Armatimonadota bacterium]|nr:hypothetical protein [Armatimonadota bacterium]
MPAWCARGWLLGVLLAGAGGAATAAVPLAPPLRPDPQTFLWGFCQVGGAKWPLSDAELERAKRELGVNALRFFVTPAWIGIPQKTWQGPEAVDYTRTPLDRLVWYNPSPQIDSVDEVVDQLRRHDVHPILMPLFITAYSDYLYKDDITFLNEPNRKPAPVDYTGIRPLEQVLHLSRALARHLHQRFGDDFTLIYDEVRGGNREPTEAHAGERERWARVVAAVKQEAPGCRVFSPELCVGMWWWPTALRYEGEVAGKPVVYGFSGEWPRGDRVEHYAASFDALSISFFEIGVEEWLKFAPARAYVQANADVPLHIARENARPKPWFWGECPWGSGEPLVMERTWSGVFFGADGCRGMLSWQLKDHEGSGSGVFRTDGGLSPTYELLRRYAAVVCAEASFFAAYHP